MSPNPALPARINLFVQRAVALGLIALIAVVSMGYFSPPARAASAYACGTGGMVGDFSVKYTGVNSTWSNYFTTARGRWNSANVYVTISHSSSAAASMTAASYSDTWYGLYTPAFWGGSFTIKVNSRTLLRDAPSGKYETWVLSTSTHELGHSLALPDNPLSSTPNASLMNHNRDRSTVGWPTAADKASAVVCHH